jgi:hypothetical protein
MKKAIYILAGIIALGVIGNLLKPKKKEIIKEQNEHQKAETKIKTVKIKEKTPMELDDFGFWDKFDPIVKVRIYKMIQEKDCSGLQQEFNTTANNMDKLQASGKGASRNLDLMDFLEEQMKDLECH